MKKLVVLFSVFALAVISLTMTAFAAYNYASPPSSPWDFTKDQTYTIAGSMDIGYTAKKTLFGAITTKKATATVSVKARPYYISYGIAMIVCSNGKLVTTSYTTPDSLDKEYTATVTSLTNDIPQMLRYDGETYQIVGEGYTTNITKWGYNTADLVVYYNW